MPEDMLKALKIVLEDFTGNTHNLFAWIQDGTLTVNKCRNGRFVAWCVWSDTNESCRYVDTLQKLSEEEIQEQLM